MILSPVHKHRWGVILAGGEGVRLRSLTRFVSGEDTPKQFCPLLGGRTLLAQTKQRVERRISASRTMYVLLGSHERFYGKELTGVAPAQMIVQPFNRGTLPAILASLIHIVRRDEAATVAFFPSDHHYSDEVKFMAGIELAFEAAEANPQSVILLGVPAKQPEVEFGWIEAEAAISTESTGGLLRVKRFWEKPSREIAQNLLDRGCVWNTFVMLGRAQSFLDMVRLGAPEMFEAFEPILSDDTQTLEPIYQKLPTADFSKVVLSAAPERLGVLCLGDVGWSDLGDPQRVVKMLAESGSRSEWIGRWNRNAAAMSAAC